MSDQPLISARGLSKVYGQGETAVEIFRDLDLAVAAGERLAIIGSSGAGKSTLLHLLGGLDEPSGGEVIIDGHQFSACNQRQRGEIRNRSLGFVYQFHHLLAEFTALENVAMPLLIGGMTVTTAQAKALLMLQQVGLGQRLGHRPGELSGGERQRAAIARALVAQPACLLADEPTGNLDRRNADEVFRLMLALNAEQGSSLIIVTHERALAERMDRILVLDDGQLRDE